MRQSSYTDSDGRKWAVWLPEGVPDRDASLGLPLGPPPLDLDLPEGLAIKLHNELFARGLFTYGDVKRRPQEVVEAVRAVIRVTRERVMAAYLNTEVESSTANADNQKGVQPQPHPSRGAKRR